MANWEKVYQMSFSSVYPMLVTKVERKGRTRDELHQVIAWLTGYNENELSDQIKKEVSYQTFFEEAPKMNEHADLITGVICGYRVEEIKEPLTKKIRQLDKLVDELAKGRKMEKILREPKPVK